MPDGEPLGWQVRRQLARLGGAAAKVAADVQQLSWHLAVGVMADWPVRSCPEAGGHQSRTLPGILWWLIDRAQVRGSQVPSLIPT